MDDEDSISQRIAEVEAETLKKLQEPKKADQKTLSPEIMTMIQEVNLVVDAEKMLTSDLGRKPTEEEIAQKSNLSVERVREIRKVNSRT